MRVRSPTASRHTNETPFSPRTPRYFVRPPHPFLPYVAPHCSHISPFILFQLSVACFCTAGVALSTRLVLGPSENASGAALFTFALTFCVADAWIGVLDAAVEAIFLCYLVDVSENDGETRPYYASAALRAYMDRHRPSYVLPCSLDDEEARAHAAALFEAEAHAMRAGEVFYFSTQTPISPICRTPLSPISQNFILFLRSVARSE